LVVVVVVRGGGGGRRGETHPQIMKKIVMNIRDIPAMVG